MANAAEQIEEVGQRTVAVLDGLMTKSKEFELAEPPEILKRYAQKLRENTYTVLVVGEAKRGKSTFVNALIGRDILPTAVEVATSQVFNVRPSERGAYHSRFEGRFVRKTLQEDHLRRFPNEGERQVFPDLKHLLGQGPHSGPFLG